MFRPALVLPSAKTLQDASNCLTRMYHFVAMTVRNSSSPQRFDVLRPRYSKLLIDTTIPGRDGDYPVGSSAELSVKVERPVW